MPQTLPQMGLTTWNVLGDNYNYQQFINNWNIVNYHDHTPGKGVPIPEGGLAPNSVGPRELVVGSWVALTLATGVTALTNAYVPSALITLDGAVRLKGKLLYTGTTLTAGSLWATIPAVTGMRPTDSSTNNLVVPGNYSTGTTETPVAVQIKPSGQIVCQHDVTTTNHLSLDGIVFTVS